MDNRSKRKWERSEKPADTANIQYGWASTVFWKTIVAPYGKIVCRVCGNTREDAENMAQYICDIHNKTLTVPSTDKGKFVYIVFPGHDIESDQRHK